MSYPTPTSPALNDLTYDSYDRANPSKVATIVQSINTFENVVLQFVGYTYKINTSDFINAGSEANGGVQMIQLNVSQPGPEALIIALKDFNGTNTGDAVKISEFINLVDLLFQDRVTTAENISIVRN